MTSPRSNSSFERVTPLTGRSTTVLMIAKIVALAPIPSASVSTTAAVKPLARRNERSANETSLRIPSSSCMALRTRESVAFAKTFRADVLEVAEALSGDARGVALGEAFRAELLFALRQMEFELVIDVAFDIARPQQR